MPDFIIINQVRIQCSYCMSAFNTTHSVHYKIHDFRPITCANIYRSITSKKYIWSVQIYMVKITRVQETVSVTMIWQYVDSLHVNIVCVLRAGDELLPSRSQSHLPVQANIMCLR